MIYKILFITLSNIGDVILTLPVLDYLRANFPKNKITVMVGPRPKEIFAGNPEIDKLIIYDKSVPLSKKINLFNVLKKEKFDLVVDLRDTLFGRLLAAKYKARRFSFRPAKVRHMRDAHLDKVLHLDQGITQGVGLKNQSLYISEGDRRYIANILETNKIADSDKIIVISAGARSEIKRWPKEKFVALINRFGEEYKAKIILIGDDNDAAINKYIRQNILSSLLDLSAKTTIGQAACLLKKAALLITNDSANLHLGSYLGVPVVAIFGPTDEIKYGPWSGNSSVVKKEIFCRPCMSAQCRFATLECMQLVGIDDVLRQVRNVLATKHLTPNTEHQKNYKRILVVRTDKIGDVILSTPVIKALRDSYPFAYIAMVVRPYTKVIVEGNPDLDEIITYDKDKHEKSWLGTFLFARRIAKKKFDLAVVLNPSNRSNLIPFLAAIPKRVGYDRKLGALLTDRIKDTKSQGLKHEIEYNLDLIRQLGIEPEDKFTYMPILEESERWAEEVLRKENILPEDKVIVLNPGASDNSKRWPTDSYAQVADKLAAKGYRVVILGGKADLAMAEEIMRKMKQPFMNMVGNNSISQAASFLKRANLFISSDTGPMHIASSLGVSIIAILGRSQPGLSPRRWRPHNQNSLVLHKHIGCRECLAHNCKKGFLCLKAITAEEVVEAAELLLKRG